MPNTPSCTARASALFPCSRNTLDHIQITFLSLSIMAIVTSLLGQYVHPLSDSITQPMWIAGSVGVVLSLASIAITSCVRHKNRKPAVPSKPSICSVKTLCSQSGRDVLRITLLAVSVMILVSGLLAYYLYGIPTSDAYPIWFSSASCALITLASWALPPCSKNTQEAASRNIRESAEAKPTHSRPLRASINKETGSPTRLSSIEENTSEADLAEREVDRGQERSMRLEGQRQPNYAGFNMKELLAYLRHNKDRFPLRSIKPLWARAKELCGRQNLAKTCEDGHPLLYYAARFAKVALVDQILDLVQPEPETILDVTGMIAQIKESNVVQQDHAFLTALQKVDKKLFDLLPPDHPYMQEVRRKLLRLGEGSVLLDRPPEAPEDEHKDDRAVEEAGDGSAGSSLASSLSITDSVMVDHIPGTEGIYSEFDWKQILPYLESHRALAFRPIADGKSLMQLAIDAGDLAHIEALQKAIGTERAPEGSVSPQQYARSLGDRLPNRERILEILGRR